VPLLARPLWHLWRFHTPGSFTDSFLLSLDVHVDVDVDVDVDVHFFIPYWVGKSTIRPCHRLFHAFWHFLRLQPLWQSLWP